MHEAWSVIVSVVWLGVVGVGRALQPFETHRGHGLELQIPVGWTVSVDEFNGTILVAEDPNDPGGAAMVLLVVPAQPGLDAAFLTDTVLSEVAPVRTELGGEETGGVVWTPHTFDADGLPAIVTSLAIAQEGAQVTTIALLSAQSDAFAELGGAYLKPAGWHFAAEGAPGQDLIYLLENPADQNGAAILYLAESGVARPAVGADLVGAVVTAFAQTLGIEAATELRSSGDGLNGARLLSGTRLGRPVKGFFAVFSDAGDVRVYGIVAEADRFDAFGGHGLMWLTLGGMSLADFERSDEMQAWYRPASAWGGDAGSGGSFAAQQMFLDMQSQMFMSWSNNMGGNSCRGNSYGCY